MDLSFAKDSKVFSAAVESLRKKGADISDAEVIKERYDEIVKKGADISDAEVIKERYDEIVKKGGVPDAPAPKKEKKGKGGKK